MKIKRFGNTHQIYATAKHKHNILSSNTEKKITIAYSFKFIFLMKRK